MREFLSRFSQDRSGNYAIIFALALPALVGFTAFGTEEGLLLFDRQGMQHAADSSAQSAAVAYSAGATGAITTQARSVAASYGFVDGDHGATVTVHQPPSSGAYQNNPQAIEVIITKPQTRLFSSLWSSRAIPILARAVALPQDQPCILALDPTADGSYSEQGSVAAHLVHCSVVADSNSNSAISVGGAATLAATFVGVVGGISGQSKITSTNGITSGYHSVADPYADVPLPSYGGCDHTGYSTHSTVTLNPGVFCGGMNLGSSAAVTLNSGIYILDQGSLSMAGSASLTGTGVTLVFTSSNGTNYADAHITGGARIDLTAPTSGPTAGIALYGDRNMPAGTSFSFRGGSLQSIGGAVYLPRGALSWAGDPDVSQRCTQIIADTISLVGDSGLSVDCTGYGTKPIGSLATLLE
jgi:hypothetical protein